MAKAEKEKDKKEQQLALGASMGYRIPLKMNLKDFDYLVSQQNKNGMFTEAVGMHRIIRSGSVLERLTLCFGHKEADRILEMINFQVTDEIDQVETRLDLAAAEEEKNHDQSDKSKPEPMKLSAEVLRSVNSYGTR